MGVFDYLKSRLALRRFKRSPLGQALRTHTQEFFYSGEALQWMNEENKKKIIRDFMAQVGSLDDAVNAGLALREKLTEYVLAYCKLMVIALRKDEKLAHDLYADNPYISGEISDHISDAYRHNEDLAHIVWQTKVELTSDELLRVANTRSTVALYYANGFNMVRIALGDTIPGRDWYRPFVEAMMVWEEDIMRNNLGLPSLIPGTMGALPYSSFMNYVLAGEQNPFFTWSEAWPEHTLAGG